jgi:hypothetical protein
VHSARAGLEQPPAGPRFVRGGPGRERRSRVEQPLPRGLGQLRRQRLGLEPAEALALISAVGDLRVGQAFGGMELTLRLEMPRSLGLVPE